MMKHLRTLMSATLTVLLLAACGAEPEPASGAAKAAPNPADLVFLNGYVYTVDADRSIAEAVAVRDGEIVGVGSNEDMGKLQGPGTEVVDLAGRMMLPGLHDVHMHIFGIVEPDVCSLNSQVLDLEETVALLEGCLQRYDPPPGEWMAVDMWNFSDGNQASERLPNLRAALDAVSRVHPIILWGNDGHHGAANSAALALAKDKSGNVVGFSAQTLAGVMSEYRDLVGVDADGEPNGEIHEQARDALGPRRRDPAVLGKLLPQIGQVLASHGITSTQDAALSTDFLPLLEDFENSGGMRFRLQVATRLDPLEWEHPETGEARLDDMLELLKANRAKFDSSPLISATAVKLFVDGVLEGNPLASPPTLPNAAVLSPYKQPQISYDAATQTASIDGYVDTASETCQEVQAAPDRFRDAASRDEFIAGNGYHPAQCVISRGVLRDQEPFVHEYVRRLNEAGFTIHVHVIGDRATRVGVDALEAAMDPSTGNPLRHTLAHAHLVHPDDQKRIGALGLYMAYTYAWALTGLPYDMTVMPFIDEIQSVEDLYDPNGYYMQNAYPVRSVMEAGAVLAAGSDAPVDDRSPRPFINMAVGITRKSPEFGVLNENETIDVHQMIAAYTINGARALSQEDSLGSIETGKRADLAVVDQNIVDLYERGQAGRIAQTQVDLTVFDGEIIYRRD
jgi:predicted amidohydrolase YtcJ